ncbi:hypothetical protein M2475_000231 [Breznakia sp. PF5-3]|uniref:hypothetical protein n=1 Tax=unclassified Breznakia TaxID=2623764 RepID=UPI002406ADF5|nr:MULTISPECIES: hypothetical protein [unclassified Breznakia]MDL2276093.1 hypothetical protein [Breznakia sp. OttesenSCG-928-G09]MDF9823883.1 hypothetical protein [Breznakia sp. PM6-1]MDF9834682.1 hypothetical protein [Breznakia sp. PF5-3]MDF9836883.1 hypothetical protein [Breznakia sp. PFB2-8]MDF9858900.1 hypothetical protein [Breznakia sp. PH5-24]
MIIFDKIKKALFTEVEEEEYVEELPVENELEKIESDKSVIYKKTAKPKVKVEPEPVYDIPEVKKVEPKEKVSFDIKVDVPQEEKKVEKRLRPIERKDYDIPQVISPITGLKEDESKSDVDYVPTVKPKNRKDSLGTVISPYYGDGELEEFHTKAQMEITSEKLSSSEVEFVEDDEIENISLDEIVSNDTSDDDEMIQFSLFGDNASLRDLSEDETKESEDYEEDRKEDDLPF